MLPEIRVLLDRLSVTTPEGAESSIAWSDVYRVHASREDLMTTTSRFLYFDFDFGEVVEVNDRMSGFEEMLSELGRYLPLPPDYKQQVDATQCSEPPITLYSRP